MSGAHASKVLAAIFAVALASCAASSGGAGGGLTRSVDDASAAMAVRARMLRSDHDFGGVDVDVVAGLVLLTGRVAEPEARVDAERIAWSAPKVRDVANEIIIGDGRRRAFGANDQLIAGQVRARLIADPNVRNANINVETYDRVVYLLGRARTEGEARRAASNASLVPGVARVVSFIRVEHENGPDFAGEPEPESTPRAQAEIADVEREPALAGGAPASLTGPRRDALSADQAAAEAAELELLGDEEF